MEIVRSSGKVLSVFGLAMINVIAIDSIRNLPLTASMGYSVVFYYLLGSLLFFVPCILITAELATHYPKTGGSYVWSQQAFGPRVGFVAIWMLWIYNVVWFPAILSFIAATVLASFMPKFLNNEWVMLCLVLGVFWVATLVNSLGTRTASWLSTFGAVVGTLLPMMLIILLGGLWFFNGQPLAAPIDWQSFMPNGDNLNYIAFSVIILFSLMGIEMSAIHAGEVQNPRRDFPRALIISAFIIVVSLVLSSIVLVMVLPLHQLNILSGITQVFQILVAPYSCPWLMPLVIAMILIGAFSGMSAWVLGPAKGFRVAAVEAGFSRWLCFETKKQAPVGVLVLQASLVSLMSFLFVCFDSMKTAYWILSALTGQLALGYYIILFITAIRLRYITPKVEGAYRIPGGNIGIWIVVLIGIATCILGILAGFYPPENIPTGSLWLYETLLIGGMLILSVLPWVLYSPKRGVVKVCQV